MRSPEARFGTLSTRQRLVILIGGASLFAAGACTRTDSTNFPPCSSDPTEKKDSARVDEGFFGLGRRVVIVDDVKFKKNGSNVDIDSKRKDAVRRISPSHVVFDGATDGRTYDVRIVKHVGRGTVTTVDTLASCETKRS